MAQEVEKKEKKDEEGAPAAAPAVGSNKKVLLVVAGVAALLLLVGVPVAILSLKKEPETNKIQEVAPDAALREMQQGVLEGAGEQEEELGDDEEPLGAIFPMDSFVVNLAKGNYLRVQMQFEFAGRDVPARFYTRLVPLRDRIISILVAKSAADLLEEQGREKMRAEVRDAVNEMLKKEDVKRVYFTQYVVQ